MDHAPHSAAAATTAAFAFDAIESGDADAYVCNWVLDPRAPLWQVDGAAGPPLPAHRSTPPPPLPSLPSPLTAFLDPASHEAPPVWGSSRARDLPCTRTYTFVPRTDSHRRLARRLV